LFEVLIVVTIIALISSGIGLAALEMKRRADDEQAHTDGRTVLTGVEAYWALHGSAHCPSVEEMMREKLFRRDGRGRDPWGNHWRIECTEDEAVVSSDGPDRLFGTKDDIRIPPV
jgi:general secretion pathway protein G